MDDAAFRSLILAEIDAVFRLACHLTRSRQDADDLVQDTYVRALRSSATFTLGDYGVRPWLFKILHNVISTRGAKSQRERAAMDELRQTAHADDNDGCHTTVGHGSIDWDNVDQRLKAAVDDLQLPYRVTFLLSAVEGLKYREIADVTEVPVGTVMSRLSRARSILATQLAGLAAEQRIGDAKIESERTNRDADV